MSIMHMTKRWGLLVAMAIGLAGTGPAADQTAAEPPLTEAGLKLEARYADQLKSLQAGIASALPTIDAQRKADVQKAREALAKAEMEAKATQQRLDAIQTAKALVEHAKGKWIGGAEKGIAQAEAALKKAATEAEREAVAKNLAKWQANKEDGIKALKERQAALDLAKADEPKLLQAHQAAQAAWTRAQADELAAAKVLLGDIRPLWAGGKPDAKLVTCVVLTDATPRGLAGFAQQGTEQEALMERLLGDVDLMQQMLVAGGAPAGRYGQAMAIYAAIQKASAKAHAGHFQRLALGVALEHAVPIVQSHPQAQTDAPSHVDPVKRYLHYEKAYQDGELDPAFKDFSAWEYRRVVGCDAPDEILAWGREMLRNYRPDHIHNPDYGWRYAATVRTEVRYGSQGVKDDLPSLHEYQNIIRNGGVCGRRAFFGRFILRSFGIPTWGVTQHKHAAVSHWTPKGWLVNLGAGFHASWWDKDGAPRSGSDFLLETQARAVPQEYLKVLQAQWVSRILGEQAYNDRKGVAGGLWSGMAHDLARLIAAEAKAADLGPLGQELAEANEAKGKEKIDLAKVTEADRAIIIGTDGVITIPAVSHGKVTGGALSMKGFAGGMQLHVSGGFKTEYTCEVPRAGAYTLTARVVTVQAEHQMQVQANDAKEAADIAVPYTMGRWQQTAPVTVSLVKGKNTLRVALKDGSRGVAIRDLILTPVK